MNNKVDELAKDMAQCATVAKMLEEFGLNLSRTKGLKPIASPPATY